MEGVSKEKIQSVLGKIQALKNISLSTHSRSEAETCLSLVAKLLAEYQLSESEVQVASGNKDDFNLDRVDIIYSTGRSIPWKSDLACGVASLYGLFIYSFRTREGTHNLTKYRIIGRSSDIEIAKYVFGHMSNVIKDLADREYPCGSFVVDQYGKMTQKRGVNPEKDSWCSGCVRGFLAKMTADHNQVMKSASSSAMILISNKAKEAEKAFLDKTGISLKTKPASKAQSDYSAMNKGYVKGQTLSVSELPLPKGENF